MCPVLFCAPYQFSVLSCQLKAAADVCVKLLLLRRLLRRLLRGSLLLRFRLCLVLFSRSFGDLLRLGFLLRKIRSLETLSAECDLSDADRRKRLPVSAKFLVLLLAFVMEDQDFCAAALPDDFAHDARIRLVADLSFFARNRN